MLRCAEFTLPAGVMILFAWEDRHVGQIRELVTGDRIEECQPLGFVTKEHPPRVILGISEIDFQQIAALA